MSLSRKTLCLLMFFSCIIVRECKGSEIKGYGPPPQCSIVDCPSYSVIYAEKEFEIRNYSQSLWLTAPSAVEYSIMTGLGRAGNNLSNYLYGGNDQGVRIIPRRGPLVLLDVLNNTYTVFYYVPHKYQNGGLPKPLRSDYNIKQVKLPKYKYVAVRRAHEDILDENVAAQVAALRKNLKGTAYERAAVGDQFTFVLYDEFDFLAGYEIFLWFN